jgi:hypothetical protein
MILNSKLMKNQIFIRVWTRFMIKMKILLGTINITPMIMENKMLLSPRKLWNCLMF